MASPEPDCTVLDVDPAPDEPLLGRRPASASASADGYHPFAGCLTRLKAHHSRHPRWVPYTLLTVTFAGIILILSSPSALSPATQPPSLPSDARRYRFPQVFDGTFVAERRSLSWLKEAGDGVYSDITSTGIELTDLKSNQTRLLLSKSELRRPDGSNIDLDSFTVSSDLRYVMVRANAIKQWRYSTRANYWVFDTLTKTLQLIHPTPGGHTNVSLAQWSPTGHSIIYVLNNDLYLLPTPQSPPLRLTTTGTRTIFNGLNDWVYEEEVFERSDAVWWSPDSSKLAYLVLDESDVPDYTLTVYNPTSQSGQTTSYPTLKPMKYPKPGFPNPIASLKLFDISKFTINNSVSGSTRWIVLDNPFGEKDRIISQVAWVSSNELIVREINRIASKEKTGYFDFDKIGYTRDGLAVGKVVMDLDFLKLDGGWAEPERSIVPVPQSSDRLVHGYLDVRIDPKGYRHIAYFSPPSASEPIFLTEGDWEVADSIKAVDLNRGLVYFVGANPSIERHIYSINLPTTSSMKNTKKQKPIQLTTGKSSFSVNWSPFGGFYLLSYDGPNVPWQKLLIVDRPEFEDVFSSNEDLNRTLNGLDRNEVIFRTVKNSVGEEMNVKEVRPHGMDKSGKKKYPVLLKVYGGPNSQVVNVKYGIDWHDFLVSSLQYIVVYLDGRGTGFKGRKFRVPVRNQLGKVEAEDVAMAARFYAGLDYVDPQRIGVWGWSYGGYLTCKVLESYSADFSLGIAVAPVTDWRFYDTIYTERYMSTPQLNPTGYDTSAVANVQGFKNVSFLLAHGSADDNVHFLNSASLLDKLTAAQVEGFEFRMFTDSDHSIYTRGAQIELYKFLTRFLINRWGVGHDSTIRLDESSWDT